MKPFLYLFAMYLLPESKFLFFLLFPNYFLFLLQSLIQENHFFSKQDMILTSSIIFTFFKFNFFSRFFFFASCKGSLNLLLVGMNRWSVKSLLLLELEVEDLFDNGLMEVSENFLLSFLKLLRYYLSASIKLKIA